MEFFTRTNAAVILRSLHMESMRLQEAIEQANAAEDTRSAKFYTTLLEESKQVYQSTLAAAKEKFGDDQ